jgi:glycosyltransferase involved in cell wall biosynthesis
MCQDAGLDVRYVPHGVDTVKFSPGDLGEARDKLGWPKDAFICGMVAANKGTPSRKSFPQQLEAFARFSRQHTDALIYLHTNKGVDDGLGGVNLPEFIAHLGITDKVRWCDEYQQIVGFPDDYMANVYRALDVLLSVSMGEGFGIPILEAQSCGCPVITGAWTSMDEITFGGWKIAREDAERWWTPLAAYQFWPRIGAIEEALEKAYARKIDGIIKHKCEQARAGALAYDADRVAAEFWTPVLDELAERRDGAPALRERVERLVRRAA